MFNSNAERDALLLKHQAAAKALAKAKADEMGLRLQVAREIYGYDENVLKAGTENVDLGAGYKLKAVFKINYTLNNTDQAVDKMLQQLEALGADGKFIADRLVKFKPELVVSEYKELPPKMKKIVDKIVSTKNASPSIEIVDPKSK